MSSRANRELRGDQDANTRDQARRVAEKEALRKTQDAVSYKHGTKFTAPKAKPAPAAPAPKSDPFSVFGAGKHIKERKSKIDKAIDDAS